MDYNEYRYYHRRYYMKVWEYLLKYNPDRIMEVGAAHPLLAVSFASYAHKKVWVDIRNKDLCGGKMLDDFNIEHYWANVLEVDMHAKYPACSFDMLICLETIEHVPEVKEFIKKLWDIAPVKVFSTPFNWDPIPGHIHNFITPEKFVSWFPEKPKYLDIVFEEPVKGSGIQLSGRIVGLFESGLTTTNKTEV